MIPIKLIIYVVVGLAIIGGATTIYFAIYNRGADSVIIKQQEKLNTLKDKTDDAKTDALTTDDPRSELRKYARPDADKQ